jgi:methylthioribose-1-phosphate isomerase
MGVEALRWEDGRLLILDQRRLPHEAEWLVAERWQDVAEAIRNMALRGAPLIGVAAAYAMALAKISGEDLDQARGELASTRPTAVNLFRALERMQVGEDQLSVAMAIDAEERSNNKSIAEAGAELVPQNKDAITICSTGSLATPGEGTALGILREAYRQGKINEIFLLETRPRLQGLRLNAWELTQDKIPFRVITDGAAASLLSKGTVGIAVAGADRIAANGDTANKIGTYSLALACKANLVPFVIAAPTTTIDSQTPDGSAIPIEERDSTEITEIDGVSIALPGTKVWNPAFDVTPSSLISAIVSENGITLPPYNFEDPS